MADLTKIEGWTAKEKKEWNDKVKAHPKHVRDVASKLDPWKLYRLRSTGQRVIIIGFNESENKEITVRVWVNAKYNTSPFERNVFGIDPNDIEECDLPSLNEQKKIKARPPLVN
jgi:hypothetical protein